MEGFHSYLFLPVDLWNLRGILSVTFQLMMGVSNLDDTLLNGFFCSSLDSSANIFAK